jgi:hypothetical protein
MFGHKATRDSAPGDDHGNFILTRVTRAKEFARKEMPYSKEKHRFGVPRSVVVVSCCFAAA